MIRLKHPLHGYHCPQSGLEEAELRKIGWVDDPTYGKRHRVEPVEAPVEAQAEPAEAPAEVPKRKPGRPKKQ